MRLQEGVCFEEENVKDEREAACFPGLGIVFWKVLALQMTNCKYSCNILILQTNGALLFCVAINQQSSKKLILKVSRRLIILLGLLRFFFFLNFLCGTLSVHCP